MNARRVPMCGSCLLLIAAAIPSSAQDAPIPGIGPTGKVERVQTGFIFTEGPAADAEGNLYFTDLRANRIYKLETNGKLSTFLEGSEGCNGLMLDGTSRLVACQGGRKRVVAIDIGTRTIDVLADRFEGQPLDRPNDLVVDRGGGVYFTDPNAKSVYYITPDGKLSRLINDLPRPNGVLLSPDEKTLYVLPSGSPDVMAYPIASPGHIGEGKVLCRLEQAADGPPRGGDGLTVDSNGNLYLTQPALQAIQVVSPNGKTLGLIHVPESPSNACFGGKDGKTLYITARTSLYAAPMQVKGHRFATGLP